MGLKQSILNKHIEGTGCPRFKVTTVSMHGNREEMEDEHSNVCFFGNGRWFCISAIFDGHCGNGTSKFLVRTLPNELRNAIEKSAFRFLRPYEIEDIYLKIDREARVLENLHSGSTAVVCIACYDENEGTYRIQMINLGDSRGILLRSAAAYKKKEISNMKVKTPVVKQRWYLSPNRTPSKPPPSRSFEYERVDSFLWCNTEDHRPEEDFESKRVNSYERRQNKLQDEGRHSFGFNVSRSFGDFSNKDLPMSEYFQSMSPIPETYEMTLCKGDDCIFLFCDGIHERIKKEENDKLITAILEARKGGSDAVECLKKIVDFAYYTTGSTDNMSITCVELMNGSNYQISDIEVHPLQEMNSVYDEEGIQKVWSAMYSDLCLRGNMDFFSVLDIVRNKTGQPPFVVKKPSIRSDATNLFRMIAEDDVAGIKTYKIMTDVMVATGKRCFNFAVNNALAPLYEIDRCENTVLHACVRYGRFEIMKMLLDLIEFVLSQVEEQYRYNRNIITFDPKIVRNRNGFSAAVLLVDHLNETERSDEALNCLIQYVRHLFAYENRSHSGGTHKTVVHDAICRIALYWDIKTFKAVMNEIPESFDLFSIKIKELPLPFYFATCQRILTASWKHYNCSPEYYSVQYKFIDWLAKRGYIRQDKRGPKMETMLHVACKESTDKVVERILNTEDGKKMMEQEDKDGNLPIHAMADRLVRHGLGSENWSDYSGGTKQMSLKILKILKKQGMSLNRKNSKGNTLLHLVSSKTYGGLDFESVIEMIRKMGGSINAMNDSGKTPFHIFSTKFKTEGGGVMDRLEWTIRDLLRIGFDPSVKRSDGKNVWEIAIAMGVPKETIDPLSKEYRWLEYVNELGC